MFPLMVVSKRLESRYPTLNHYSYIGPYNTVLHNDPVLVSSNYEAGDREQFSRGNQMSQSQPFSGEIDDCFMVRNLCWCSNNENSLQNYLTRNTIKVNYCNIQLSNVTSLSTKRGLGKLYCIMWLHLQAVCQPFVNWTYVPLDEMLAATIFNRQQYCLPDKIMLLLVERQLYSKIPQQNNFSGDTVTFRSFLFLRTGLTIDTCMVLATALTAAIS